MAALARRTWAQIQNETQRRLGGINSTGPDGVAFTTRIQYWLAASYLDLCLKYFHHELFKLDTSLTIASGGNTLTLPSDCFIVIVLLLRSSATEYEGQVTDYSTVSLLGAYRGATAKPDRMGRGATKLYFNTKSDATYSTDLYYYRRPALPDFGGSDSPETAVEMDEHIMEGACRIANPAIGRPDHGDIGRQLLVEWLTDQVRPRLVDEPLKMRERVETNRVIGVA